MVKRIFNNLEYYHNEYLSTSGQGKDWCLHFSKCTKKPKDFYSECIRAARLIYDKSTKDVYCFLSGGRDSIYMTKAFYDSGVKFKVAIMDWNGLNDHDISNALDFCYTYGIQHEFIPFNIIEFIESGQHSTLSKNIGTWTHQIAPLVKAVQTIDGNVVLGNGDPMFIPTNLFDKTKWYYFDHQILNCMNNYFSSNGIPAISEFYRYTPELFYSFIIDKNIINLLSCSVYDTSMWRKHKYKLYEDHFSDKFSFPKYDGWETLYKTHPNIVEKCINDISDLHKDVSGEYLRSHKHLKMDLYA